MLFMQQNGHMNRLLKLQPRTDYARTFMCALDFVRAMNERPAIVKWFCRLFFGRSAYGEFMLMIRSMEEYDPFYSYGLDEATYHQREPLIWWNRD